MAEFASSLGATVHYVAYGTPGGEYPKMCRAAIMTVPSARGWDDLAALCVLNPTGLFFNRDVPRGFDGGHWHYPAECRSDG